MATSIQPIRNSAGSEALAIRGDSIVAAGTTAEVEKLRAPSTKVIDLAGRMAMPGIIDDHTHFIGAQPAWLGCSLQGPDGCRGETTAKRICQGASE